MENVTAGSLGGVFESQIYRNALDCIINHTKKHSMEAAFKTYKVLGKDDLVFPGSIDEGEELIVRSRFYPILASGNGDAAYLLVSTHTHPYGDLVPSDGDMNTLSAMRQTYRNDIQRDVKPVEVVATSLFGTHRGVFLFQERTSDPVKNGIPESIFAELKATFQERHAEFAPYETNGIVVFPAYDFAAQFIQDTGYYNTKVVCYPNSIEIPLRPQNLEKFAFEF